MKRCASLRLMVLAGVAGFLMCGTVLAAQCELPLVEAAAPAPPVREPDLLTGTVPGPLDLDLSYSMENYIVNTSDGSVDFFECTITSANGELFPECWDVPGTTVDGAATPFEMKVNGPMWVAPLNPLPIGPVSFAWNDPEYTFTYKLGTDLVTTYEGGVLIWIPEPTTLSLLSVAALGLIRRRR
jgi:hypothetical protein